MRCRLALSWLPRQYAAELRVSLNAGMWRVVGMCGPRHRSLQTRSRGAGIQVVVGGELVAADLHHLRVAGLVVDELEFVRLVGKLLAGFVFRFEDASGEQLTVLDDLAHPLFQRLEVFRGEGLRHIEVVVEPVDDRRSDAELGVGKHVLHGLGQHMRAGVPDDAAAVLRVGGDRHHLDVDVRRPAEVAQASVGVAHDHDRAGFTASGQARVADGRPGGGPGGHPKRGCGGGTGGGRHRGFSKSARCSQIAANAIRASGHDPTPIGLFSHGQSSPTNDAAQPSAPTNHSVAITTAMVNTKPAIFTQRPWRLNHAMTLS